MTYLLIFSSFYIFWYIFSTLLIMSLYAFAETDFLPFQSHEFTDDDALMLPVLREVCMIVWTGSFMIQAYSIVGLFVITRTNPVVIQTTRKIKSTVKRIKAIGSSKPEVGQLSFPEPKEK